MRWLYIPLCFVCFMLSGCSDTIDPNAELQVPEIPDSEPIDSLYNDAMDKLQQKNWKGAKKAFEEVERQHPYSPWAKRAQVLNAYANYENQDYDEAIAILQRFVQLYPGDDRVPYAFYLTALSYYEQITDVGRDQAMTDRALKALEQVIRRFPDSSYARDAKLKRDLTIDHLAGKEMEVGRYYLKRDEYLGSIKRFSKVIERYQGTTHTPEALHRLVESYLLLGVRVEALKYAAVLGHNYPNNQWYKDSFKLLNPDSKDVPVVKAEPSAAVLGEATADSEEDWMDFDMDIDPLGWMESLF